MIRRCNRRLLEDTADTHRRVSSSLPAPTNASISRQLEAAAAAARRGRCADMHKHAQAARGTLERRLDMLLGRIRSRKRRR